MSYPLKSDKWVDYQFSFTPDKDGKLVLILMGPWVKPNGAEKAGEIWCLFDDIVITGWH